jgi:hypothetical protein
LVDGALGAGAIRFHGIEHDYLIVFNLVGKACGLLGDDSIANAPHSAAWELILSSNDHRFGGDGSAAFNA